MPRFTIKAFVTLDAPNLEAALAVSDLVHGELRSLRQDMKADNVEAEIIDVIVHDPVNDAN